MCWNSGVRKRLKLCSMMKIRKKSGLPRAQRMYQGRAVRQKNARAAGWKRGEAVRPGLGESADEKNAAARRVVGAGAFAKTGGGAVEERRLLNPRLAIEAGGDPIAGLGHVARDPGVARLVRPDEADGAKMAEVADVERGCDENGPANSSGGAGARVLGNWSGCFGHGKLSLTSNHYLPATDLLHTVARRETRANLDKR